MPDLDGGAILKAVTGAIDDAIAAARAVWNGLAAIFQWPTLPAFPAIDTAALASGFEDIQRIVGGAWAFLQDTFGQMIGLAGDLGEKVGAAIGTAVKGARSAMEAISGLMSGPEGVERILADMAAVADEGAWRGAAFTQGQALAEGLQQGQISLDAYRGELEAIIATGGNFADTAQRMLDASRQLDAFEMPAPPPVSPQVAADADAALAKLTAVEKAAQAVPGVVQTALAQANAVLSGTSFFGQGARLMETLAAGMRARAQAVVAEIQRVTQQVRDHLPSSPAKVGPLSDIHRLQFMETIARSMRPDPMVAAMRTAAAATLAAVPTIGLGMATPALADASAGIGALQTPVIANPSARALAASGSGGGASGAGQTVHITFAPQISVGAGASITLDEIAQVMDDTLDDLLDRLERRRDEDDRLTF